MPRVLLAIDDGALRQRLQLLLREQSYDAAGVSALDAAGVELTAERYDYLILDVTRAAVRRETLELLGIADKRGVVTIAIVPPGDRQLAAELMAGGVHDWVKALPEPRDLLDAIDKAERRQQYSRDHSSRPGAVAPRPTLGEPSGSEIVARSARMLELLRLVRRMAEHKTTVLIGGESGTGKELIARALHRHSPRSNAPFLAVNCGAIPANLLEAELFGYRKGAFTDALRDRRGLFEEASGGTLFLDEIGELPLALQVKLLRVLQEEELRRLGDTQDIRVDVRVVAATARDLPEEVRAGRFREDLYYRLNVMSLHLPPLRERTEDIPALVEHFVAAMNGRFGRVISGVTPEALQLLRAYGWPGNVRELENVIERAVVLAEDNVIEASGLPDRLHKPGAPASSSPEVIDGIVGDDLSIKRASRRAEEDLIRRALARTGGNRTRAAELLEISHRALLYKIKEYGIVSGRGEPAPSEPGTSGNRVF